MYSFYLEGYETKEMCCPYIDAYMQEEWFRGFRDQLDDLLS